LIKVANVNTGIERDTITNELGIYTVELLPVGQYRVEVELAGFKKEVRSGITLQVDQTARIDFVLTVGQLNEVVEVTGEAPLVQTESSLGAVIEDRKVTELPLNGRDFSSLAYIIPWSLPPDPGFRGTPVKVKEPSSPLVADLVKEPELTLIVAPGTTPYEVLRSTFPLMVPPPCASSNIATISRRQSWVARTFS